MALSVKRSTSTTFDADDLPRRVWNADHAFRRAVQVPAPDRHYAPGVSGVQQEADVHRAAAGTALRAPTGASPTRFLSCVPASFKYGAEAMALMGIAYGLIKWVGRTLRSLISDAPLEASRLDAVRAQTPLAAADALVRQGIVSAAEFERMTPREREFLMVTAGPQLRAASNRVATGTRPTPTGADAVSGARSGVDRAPLTPPRLHLITPSRPPLGIAVHCPGCGEPLDRDELQRTGTTSCSRCKRPVSAHIQRGRLTVIVEETPDEADHRRRLDGGP